MCRWGPWGRGSVHVALADSDNDGKLEQRPSKERQQRRDDDGYVDLMH